MIDSKSIYRGRVGDHSFKITPKSGLQLFGLFRTVIIGEFKPGISGTDVCVIQRPSLEFLFGIFVLAAIIVTIVVDARMNGAIAYRTEFPVASLIVFYYAVVWLAFWSEARKTKRDLIKLFGIEFVDYQSGDLI